MKLAYTLEYVIDTYNLIEFMGINCNKIVIKKLNLIINPSN